MFGRLRVPARRTPAIRIDFRLCRKLRVYVIYDTQQQFGQHNSWQHMTGARDGQFCCTIQKNLGVASSVFIAPGPDVPVEFTAGLHFGA